jgi:hypothetical protein
VSFDGGIYAENGLVEPIAFASADFTLRFCSRCHLLRVPVLFPPCSPILDLQVVYAHPLRKPAPQAKGAESRKGCDGYRDRGRWFHTRVVGGLLKNSLRTLLPIPTMSSIRRTEISV